MSEDDPVAWAANIPGKYGAAPTMLFGYTENLVRSIAAAGGDSVAPFPLYRQSQATLTDAEREAVSRYEDWLAWCEEHNQIGDCGRKDRVSLRGLLDRTETVKR
jgi:predicted  nucleic acid-binding Zn ribbon protein